jgi:osmoprotectant transport system permease protein
MAEQRRSNLLLVSLSVLVVAALFGLPFLQVAPNRLVSGQPMYVSVIMPAFVWLLLALLLSVALVTVFKPQRSWIVVLLALSVALVPGLLWLAASQAAVVLQGANSIARASFGSAFWLSEVLLAFLATSSLQQLRAMALQRIALSGVLAMCIWAMLGSGLCDDLSLVKEYSQRADDFSLLLVRHVQIVLLALAATVSIGCLLGLLARSHAKFSRALLPVLNIIQTIPSIALFGLLMAPLSLLAASLPALGRVGISGVGLAPAVIALTLYGLLPVVRSVLAGLLQVPATMHSAATALGLTPSQVLVQIELPLALPVLLGGIRTAAVASVGLAAITALIGAGGLGSILFEGLFSNAQDLVLLGVLPIVALGLLVDALFNLLIGLARRRAHPC